MLLKVASPGSAYEGLLRIRAARQTEVAVRSLPLDVDADLKIAEYFRARRIEYGKSAADEEYRVADEELRGAGSTIPASGRPADSVQSPDLPAASDKDDSPGETGRGAADPQHVPAVYRLPDSGGYWSGQSARNILGMPGSGIHQYVGGRWKLGTQIPNADLSLGWRTPYLAEDMLQIYSGVAALKKVHPPNVAHGSVEAQQEIMSLPQGEQISPYVAEVIQSGFDPVFGWYVVTPYYANGTLQRRMESETPLTLNMALVITEQILQGLLDAFTWQNRLLVHMDIKPPNIAFGDEGNVRIIDWGLAASLNPDYQLSISAAPRYTMWYAPPEQVMPPPDSVWLSPACDIRAVGAVCYTMITGRPPLYVEAFTAGLIDSSGNLKKWNEEDFKKLLANNHPMPLNRFFAATKGWDPDGVLRLSELVTAWLDPLPAGRIAADGDKPSQQSALEALRHVIQDIRANYPHLLANEIGDKRMQIPQMGSADIVLAPTESQKLRGPDAETVHRAKIIDDLPGNDRENGAEQ